jgi:hypothetical protein
MKKYQNALYICMQNICILECKYFNANISVNISISIKCYTAASGVPRCHNFSLLHYIEGNKSEIYFGI